MSPHDPASQMTAVAAGAQAATSPRGMHRLRARLLCLITVVAVSILVGPASPAAAADLIVVLQSEGGGKESNPLSVIVPLLLVAVWAGTGILMFRKVRARKRSTGPPD